MITTRAQPDRIIRPQLYTSIHRLMLEPFLSALIDKDYSGLVIEGEPSEQDILSAWQEIHLQYQDALSGELHTHFIKLCVKLHRLQIKHNKIHVLVEVLKKYYVALFADALNKYLFQNLSFDYLNQPAYLKDLEKCANRNKAYKIEIELTANAIEAIGNKAEGDYKEPSRDDFYKTLITLSDFAGRDIHAETLSVFQYCERLKRFIAHVRKQVNDSKTQRGIK